MKRVRTNEYNHFYKTVGTETPRWTFNNYKKACSLDLSQEEFVELVEEGIRITKSNLPAYIRNSVENAIITIDKEREDNAK